MIHICIPTHNEQQTVGVVLWKLRQVFTEYPRDYQLLVADDASTDKTADVLEPYTRVLPLTVIRSERRLGMAASLEMLLREAVRRSEYPRRDVIIALQADFSEEPDDVVPFIKRIEAGADIVVGNKVSAAREPRSRRLARWLASQFLRGWKWPESVATPFDSYRAYRLQSIKRAIEDRAGKRLIRYDGWAGQAELLHAVLPHARRVDAVTVEDRPDRLQRPRRERAFAYAMQVRAMAKPADPPGLVSVEELDRIASTASRSRERSVAVAGAAPAARGSTNGAGRQQQRGRRGAEDRTGTADRRGSRRSGGTRSSAQAPTAAKPAKETSNGTAPRGTKERGEDRRRRRTTETPEAAVATPDTVEAIDATAAAGAEEAPRPKKKRRRRKRGKSQAAATAQAGEPAAPESGTAELDAATAAGADSGPETADTGEPVKKKRRRGGRRGGRGRRRRAGGAESADGAESAGGAEPAGNPESAGGVVPAGGADGPRSSSPGPESRAGGAEVGESHTVTRSTGTVDAQVDRAPTTEVAGGA